jgi:hypothetical protein
MGQPVFPQKPLIGSVLVLLLTVAAVGLLAKELGRGRAENIAREYQQVLGGLGFGPALDLSRCANSFDPRVCPRCTDDLGPVAGGGYFCPQHASSILYYPALDAAP